MFKLFSKGLYPGSMNEEAVLYPTETILFGEKKTLSNQYYLDLSAGTLLDVTEQGRHSRPIVSSPFSGGSNHGFADGSATFNSANRFVL